MSESEYVCFMPQQFCNSNSLLRKNVEQAQRQRLQNAKDCQILSIYLAEQVLQGLFLEKQVLLQCRAPSKFRILRTAMDFDIVWDKNCVFC